MTYKFAAASVLAAALAIAPMASAQARGWDHHGGGGHGGGHGGWDHGGGRGGWDRGGHGGHNGGLILGLIGGALVAAATIATLPVRAVAEVADPGPGYYSEGYGYQEPVRYERPYYAPRYAYAPPPAYYPQPVYAQEGYGY